MSSSDEQKKKRPPPSFAGNVMPDKVSLTMDDGGEEVTRRVAAMPSFQPSFEPMIPVAAPTKYSTGSSDQASMPSVAGKPAAVTVVQVAAPTAPVMQWKLTSVPVLPEYHPLERTAVLVPRAASDPSIVSTRISDVLRQRSIEAVYLDDKAKVQCKTLDGVDFRIRLYRGRAPDYDNDMIVEVQRRMGMSTTFHNDTTAILQAAQGLAPPPPTAASTSSALPLVSDSEDETMTPTTDGSSSLTMVVTMMQHPGYDAQHLALQTLASLTDGNKMGPGTARTVSRHLLIQLRDDPMQQGSTIVVLSRVLELVCVDSSSDDKTTSRGANLDDSSGSLMADDDKDAEQTRMFDLRLLALTVLANVLYSSDKHQELVKAVPQDSVCPALVDILIKAEQHPRLAVQAARCVEYLELAGQLDLQRLELVSAVQVALAVGQSRHAGLEQQAQVSLDRLQQS